MSNKPLQWEVDKICNLLLEKDDKSVQIDGYGDDFTPAKGFGDRFENTLKAVQERLAEKDLVVKGFYSEGGPWVQPYSCWKFYIPKVWTDK